ncbi:unnamed protein product [Leptidea sinapis]|uniref:DDE Tnp4 domain-containing protein n=1 Tax=Leptidea sinapis TaxID=189913 RepID=A0A5E4QKL5_9NEOP|nr:unnamed protein product [Leptidea sinapis]
MTTVSNIIVACAMLHNLSILLNDVIEDTDEPAPTVEEENTDHMNELADTESGFQRLVIFVVVVVVSASGFDVVVVVSASGLDVVVMSASEVVLLFSRMSQDVDKYQKQLSKSDEK